MPAPTTARSHRRRHQRPDHRQDAQRLRRAVHLLRDLRPDRRQLGVRQPQRAQQRLPLAAHRHLEGAAVLPRLPDAGRLPGLPAPHPDQGLPGVVRRGVRPQGEHRVQQRRRVSARPARGQARLGDRRPGRHHPARSTTSSSANGHHWDPRFADFPGEFTGVSIHSHHYIDPKTPLDFFGARILVVGLGNSAADIAVELSSQVAADQGDPLDPVRRLDRAEVRLRQAGRHDVPDHAVPAAVVAAQGDADGPADERVQRRALRAARAEPQVLRGAPDPVGRAAAAARLRRRGPEAEHLPARRQRRCTSRTAPATTST